MAGSKMDSATAKLYRLLRASIDSGRTKLPAVGRRFKYRGATFRCESWSGGKTFRRVY